MEELLQKWEKCMKEQGKGAKMEHKWARSGEKKSKWGNYQSKMVKCGRNQHTQHHPSVGPVLPVQYWPAPQVFWHNSSMGCHCPSTQCFQHSTSTPSTMLVSHSSSSRIPVWPQCSQYNTSMTYSQIKILV